MVRISKVYTRTGDDGTTALATGERVRKDSLRIASYGTVDELNSVLSLARSSLMVDSFLPAAEREQLDSWLVAIQNDLFNLGADFATPSAAHWEGMVRASERDVEALERLIDVCQQRLPRLREFVLPGGSRLNAELHLARTVCRRAERCAVELSAHEEVNPLAIQYLNRLSDFFFVASRWVLSFAPGGEVLWSRDSGVRAFHTGL